MLHQAAGMLTAHSDAAAAVSGAAAASGVRRAGGGGKGPSARRGGGHVLLELGAHARGSDGSGHGCRFDECGSGAARRGKRSAGQAKGRGVQAERAEKQTSRMSAGAGRGGPCEGLPCQQW